MEFLGSIAVKEGETVNVGSLLGTINGSSTKIDNLKEVNNYNPPKEKEEKNQKFLKKKKL